MTILTECRTDLVITGMVELEEIEEPLYRIEAKINGQWSPVHAHATMKQARGYGSHGEAVLMAESITRMVGHETRVICIKSGGVTWP